MKEKKLSQLEMFPLDEERTNASTLSTFNLKYIKNYEKIILLIFSFLILGIISYCWGFKEGKRVALLRGKELDINLNINKESKEMTTYSLSSDLGSKKEDKITPAPKEKTEEEKEKSSYTIQVATYKNFEFAQREADRLKRKGFATKLINKGNYILLCVGSFFNKKEAEMVLTKLKKNYGDCFIRRF
jgi:hypothetical protein